MVFMTPVMGWEGREGGIGVVCEREKGLDLSKVSHLGIAYFEVLA